MKPTVRTALAAFFSLALAFSAHADRENLRERIVTAEYVLEEIMANPDTAIPAQILQDAQGIILTLSYRGGFLIGGQGGQGVLIAKNPLTGEWGVPAFISTGGANIGLQIGIKEFDTAYLVMDLDTLRKSFSGRMDLGADATAVAGPLSNTTESINNLDYRNANILVYTSKKGLFAGVAVKAGWVRPNNKATQQFYNTDYNMPEIVLSDWFELPSEATALLQRLNYYTQGNR